MIEGWRLGQMLDMLHFEPKALRGVMMDRGCPEISRAICATVGIAVQEPAYNAPNARSGEKKFARVCPRTTESSAINGKTLQAQETGSALCRATPPFETACFRSARESASLNLDPPVTARDCARKRRPPLNLAPREHRARDGPAPASAERHWCLSPKLENPQQDIPTLPPARCTFASHNGPRPPVTPPQ